MRTHLVGPALVTPLLLAGLSAHAAPVKITGPTLQRFGYVTRPVGDLNGDGHQDFVASAPIIGVDKVYVFFGPMVAGNYTIAAADLIFSGPSGSETGWAVAGPGDIDGDGHDDLVIGAPSAAGGKGQVYILEGPLSAGAVSYTSADVTMTGGSANDIFGVAVDVGDYDDDGYDDVLVGAPWVDIDGHANVGKAYLFLGPSWIPAKSPDLSADYVFKGTDAGANTGWAVAFAGDMDGVGGEELLIGAPRVNLSIGAEGTVYLVWSGIGAGSRSLEDTRLDIARIRGDRWAAEFGNTVAGRGDIDGDGLDDVLLGAPSPYCVGIHDGGSGLCGSDHGSAHVFTGAPRVGSTPALLGELDATDDASFTIVASTLWSGLAFGLAMVPDFNGDGVDDLLLGSMSNKAYLYYGGGLSGLTLDEGDADATYTGDGASDYLGLGVGAGDLNGDGAGDLLLGAPAQKYYSDGPQPVAGKVYGHFGTP